MDPEWIEYEQDINLSLEEAYQKAILANNGTLLNKMI